MKIISMTATFGKLDAQTLELTEGLNLICAPNEWGKSTWCAFLLAMLYGIDTRARTTKDALAEKEKYAPWSGSPMEGRIDLSWNGRDITIERRTKGRTPFGVFKAYETATGLEVPELTGANCGQMLLGVERAVFARAGFLKLTDLPVTQDDALRRRLNSLVTTGDESGAGDKLASKLKDLKNKVRYNRSGLLPQAEEQREQLQQRLYDLQELTSQAEATRNRQHILAQQVRLLENHKVGLRYAASLEDARKVAEAQTALVDAENAVAQQQALCRELPSLEDARAQLEAADRLQQQWLDLQQERSGLPLPPTAPEIPAHYRDISPEQAIANAEEDYQQQLAIEKKRRAQNRMAMIYGIVAGLLLIGMGVLYSTQLLALPLAAAGGAVSLVGCCLAIVFCLRAKKWRQALDALYDRHPGLNPGLWVSDAQAYAASQEAYVHTQQCYHEAHEAFSGRLSQLEAQLQQLPGGSAQACRERCRSAMEHWDELEDAKRLRQQADIHLRTVTSMAETAPAPEFEDQLTFSPGETESRMTAVLLEQHQNQLRLGQLQGQAEALGSEAQLRSELTAVRQRIHRLEDTYQALELAQRALSLASNELQRRFAPKISKRAQALFGRMTGGRYQKLSLSEDLSLNAGAEDEDTLRSSLWRSEGTVDQLYLALRLAVAEELTPNAPLVLDDALVRFDDQRLKAAMEILSEAAEQKQVILFTCQNREQNCL